jgi:hypothetical protein
MQSPHNDDSAFLSYSTYSGERGHLRQTPSGPFTYWKIGEDPGRTKKGGLYTAGNTKGFCKTKSWRYFSDYRDKTVITV